MDRLSRLMKSQSTNSAEAGYLREPQEGSWSSEVQTDRTFRYKPEDFVDFDDFTREMLEEYGGRQAMLQRQGAGEISSALSGHDWAEQHIYPENTRVRSRYNPRRAPRIQDRKYRFGIGWGGGSFVR